MLQIKKCKGVFSKFNQEYILTYISPEQELVVTEMQIFSGLLGNYLD